MSHFCAIRNPPVARVRVAVYFPRPHRSPMADTIDLAKFRDELRVHLQTHNVPISSIAAKSGVHKATIHRLLDEDYQFTPSLRTLQKLRGAMEDIAALRQIMPAVEDGSQRITTGKPLNISDIAGAGLWLTHEQRRSMDVGETPLCGIQNIPTEYETAFRVTGRSGEPYFLDGDVVRVGLHGASAPFGTPGDFVVIIGANKQNEVEYTIRQVVSMDAMSMTVRFPSQAPEWQGTLKVNHDQSSVHNGIAYGPFGLIIGIYRPLNITVAQMLR